jgi:hypothetical protein
LEEKAMGDFKPSGDFVTRTMEDIHSYETERSKKRERVHAFLLSRPVFYVLSAGGILLGVFNLVRMASILIFPALCR